MSHTDGVFRPAGVNVVPTESFSSATSLERALWQHHVPPDVKTLLLDLESWKYTPVQERSHLVYSYRRAEVAAHQAGYELIAAPGLDVVGPGSNVDRAMRMLSARYLPQIARSADALVIQSQSFEDDPTRYDAYVAAAARQVRAVHQVPIFAGLSTSPTGYTPTPGLLRDLAQSVRNLVTGFWLNVPSAGHRCPRCGAFRVSVAIRLLEH